jgi:PEGA domain
MRVLTVLGVLAAGTAAGAPDRSAVVAVGQCSVTGSAISARSFRAAMTQRFGASVQTEAETAAPFGGLSERTLPELNGALNSARNDYYSDKPEPALATLNKALEDITRLMPSDGRWSTERDMLTFLAQIQLKGDKPAAEATLARVFRVDPDFKPDTSVYPPSFQKFISDVRKAVAKRPTNRLDIAVSPPGKRVFVDGKRVGVAPLSLRLPVGDYVVEVDWGYRGLGRTVTVPAPPAPTRPLELAAAVEGAVAPDGGPCVEPDADMPATLSRLLPKLNVTKIYGVRTEVGTGADQYASVTEVSGGGSEQRTIRVKLQPGAPEGEALGLIAGYFATGRGGPRVEVVPKGGGAAVPTVAPPLVAAVPPAVAAPKGAAPAAAVTKSAGDGGSGLRVAGWVLVGVGVGGLAVGVVEFLSANSQKNDLASKQVNGAFPAGYQSQFTTTNDSIKSSQTIAVIAGGAGVAALATGVVLLFVAGGQSGNTGVSVSPAFMPGGGGAMLAGSF